ncbi:TNase-like domain-containing protein [Pseudoscourfieldia marina]
MRERRVIGDRSDPPYSSSCSSPRWLERSLGLKLRRRLLPRATATATSLSSLFKDSRGFNEDVSNWDMSNVTNMAYMFYHDVSGSIDPVADSAYMLNQDIGNWHTSKVTNMNSIFYVAQAFKQDISNSDTSKVTNMANMFRGAATFNQDISKWDTSQVEDMEAMFWEAQKFNQDISNWDTSKVTSMKAMFNGAKSMTEAYKLYSTCACILSGVRPPPAGKETQVPALADMAAAEEKAKADCLGMWTKDQAAIAAAVRQPEQKEDPKELLSYAGGAGGRVTCLAEGIVCGKRRSHPC